MIFLKDVNFKEDKMKLEVTWELVVIGDFL
jgi:hypothetical protein